jgi:hypothetical protein
LACLKRPVKFHVFKQCQFIGLALRADGAVADWAIGTLEVEFGFVDCQDYILFGLWSPHPTP